MDFIILALKILYRSVIFFAKFPSVLESANDVQYLFSREINIHLLLYKQCSLQNYLRSSRA